MHQRYLPCATSSLAALLPMLGDLLFRPHFCQTARLSEVWESLKGQQRERIEFALETETERTIHHLWQHVAPDHPSAWPLYGFAEEIDEVQLDEVANLYRRLLGEAHLHVFVVGAVSEQEVVDAALPAFGRAERSVSQAPSPFETLAKRGACHQVDIRSGGSHVALALHVGDVFAHAPAYFMLTNWFSLLPDSRLMQIARTEQQWVYRINTYLREDTGYLLLHTTLDWQNRHAFVEMVQRVLRQMQECPLTDVELRDLATACVRKLKGRSDLPWRAIEFQLQTLLAGSAWTLANMIEAFPNVTAAEIQHVAQQLSLDTVTFVGGASA